VGSLIEDRIRTLLRHRRRARQKGTSESVHDVRVATRRLQEALELFAPAFPARERERLRRRARRIRRSLAEVRDADVLLGLVRRLRHGSTERGAPGLAALERRLLAKAERLRRRLERPRDGSERPGPGLRIRGIRKRASALLQADRAEGDGRIGAAAFRVAGQRARAVRAALGPARTGRAVALHRLRIAIKRYRYCLETLEAWGMTVLSAGIARARDLQERLGAIHDLDVLIRVTRGARAASLLRSLRAERRRLAAAARSAIAGFRPLVPRGPARGGRR
jgi:CHAD domain-containing protein